VEGKEEERKGAREGEKKEGEREDERGRKGGDIYIYIYI